MTAVDTADTDTDTRHFPSVPMHVGEARRFIAEHLPPGDPRHDDLMVCASEVVTNAINHTGHREAGFDVTVATGDGAITVTVTDGGGTGDPVVRGNDTADPHGRGVALVDALSDTWGFERTEAATRVWFTFHAVDSQR